MDAEESMNKTVQRHPENFYLDDFLFADEPSLLRHSPNDCGRAIIARTDAASLWHKPWPL